MFFLRTGVCTVGEIVKLGYTYPVMNKTQLLAKIRKCTFTMAYIEALLWSTLTDGNEPHLNANYDPEDFTIPALKRIIADCEKFQLENIDDIDGNFSQAGHDFWLTRAGHGAGFWEIPDWPGENKEDDTRPGSPSSRLTDAAKMFGECYVYTFRGRLYI